MNFDPVMRDLDKYLAREEAAEAEAEFYAEHFDEDLIDSIDCKERKDNTALYVNHMHNMRCDVRECFIEGMSEADLVAEVLDVLPADFLTGRDYGLDDEEVASLIEAVKNAVESAREYEPVIDSVRAVTEWLHKD